MNRLRTGDTVIVISGKSKGHVGKVLRVLNAGLKRSVVVEGANLVTEYVKDNPQANQKGGIFKKEAPLNDCKVAYFDSKKNKAARVGFKFIEKDGTLIKVRYLKSSGEQIDFP